MSERKKVLITGANSGIGLSSAHLLAAKGWDVLLLCRNAQKGDAVVAELRKKHPQIQSKNYAADLSNLESVRKAAAQILAEHPRIDVLLNNAGYYPAEIKYVGNVEETLYASHFGHFVLTQALLPALEKSAQGRVVNVSSTIHSMGKVKRFFQGPNGISAIQAYADAKLANILFTMALAKRLPPQMTTYSLHPGVVNTGFAHNSGGLMGFFVKLGGRFLTPPDKGAATSVYLTTAPITELEGLSGRYFDKCKAIKTRNDDATAENAEWLWEKTEEFLAQPS
ncbi:MAG: SDR family NAD(P)-dependent oxidoreductase [Bacteroidia bacterium]